MLDGEDLEKFLPLAVAIPAVAASLILAHVFLGRREKAGGGRFRAQLVLLLLSIVGVVVLILVLPVERETEGALLGFFGLLLSAAIALSSTTLLGNVMAGITQRLVGNFRVGDFIRCGEHFGRVTERGIVHTEIQTEDRDLTTLPNLYLVNNPMTVIRSSGTIISARVSIGYDVQRSRVQELLLDAGKAAELDEPFVRLIELGDFSVTYCVGGMLTDVKRLLSTRTRLRECMLDALHAGSVEIASPWIVSQRQYSAQEQFIPREAAAEPQRVEGGKLEKLAFDKAEMAESLDELRRRRESLVAKKAELGKSMKEHSAREEREAIEAEIARHQAQIERLDRVIEAQGGTLESLDEPDGGS